jgi:hypothetical protein
MFSTFSYENRSMLIASKAWSDFASHIPLIRSFSLGNNFPPEYPLFAGSAIKYHFLFYLISGILEKIGIRIDYALNIPSIIGFTLLMLAIYLFAKQIFKSRTVGILSIIFFIFNGSLDFIKFFQLHPLSLNTVTDIIINQKFISFGPYDNSIISAFWNLNIYTNQRHLALSYAASLILIFFMLKPFLENKKPDLRFSLLMGIILGLSFFLNMAVFLMTIIIFSVLFLMINKHRLSFLIALVVAGLIASPQYLYIQSGNSASQISLYVGYLVNNNLTVANFISYWFQNLGLHLILIPVGFLLAPKKIKKIFIAFFALFIIGNLFKFSPEIAANHKFFNLFLIVGVMYSSYFIVHLWNKKDYLKPFAIMLVFFLVLSGIIDFFPIFNDAKISLADYPVNKDISWIIKNTKPSSVFLNTDYLYDNASLAGRKIFLGWPYFAWSQGYDTLSRDNLRKSLFVTNNLKFFCDNILKYKINYAEINPNSNNVDVNMNFFNVYFLKVYESSQSNYYIYKLDKCI